MGDFLEWVYNVFTCHSLHLAGVCTGGGAQVRAAGQGTLGSGVWTVVIILSLVGWTGIYRLVRAEYMKHRSREYVMAAEAIGASQWLAHVHPHPAQHQPRGAGAIELACGELHQGRGDPFVTWDWACRSTW
jgi:hypothetical protein